MNFIVNQAKMQDILGVSQVHLHCFSGHFLSNFGNRFLNVYYSNYLTYPKHLLLIAKFENKIVGFVAGTLSTDLLYRSLFRENFFTIARLTLFRFMANGEFRKQLFKRLHFVKGAIKSKILSNKNREKTAPEQKLNNCRLLSIAVLRDFWNKGASLKLIMAFEQEVKKRGAQECFLSVKKDNLRAVGFYQKAGWRISKEAGGSYIFTKNLSSIKNE